MSLLPYRFLFRLCQACPYVSALPDEGSGRLFELPESARLDCFSEMDGRKRFADVRLAWNEKGLGWQVSVTGKQELPRGDAAQPRLSDGATLWLDTRDSRTSHRASRFCHQFHLLPTGGGPEHDEPIFLQSKIGRALQDAPLADPNEVLLHYERTKSGYLLQAFLPVQVLAGYDPEQNRRLGVYYAIRDLELGDQVLTIGADFPFGEDPSLWSVLELVRAE